jgi:cytochrome c peroxidase
MNIKRFVILAALVAGVLLLYGTLATAQESTTLTPEEELGKSLFFDQNLSLNSNMSCAACHGPEVGFTGPTQELNMAGAVYEGSVSGMFGNRKPPAAAYAGDSPVLFWNAEAETWMGGMFWDGRATGETLGDPLTEQAQGPFLNPLEMAVPDAATLCQLVAKADYADAFVAVWGAGSLDCAADVDGVYERIARSIAAYERSSEVTAFTSKYDYYLAGKVELTDQEALGLQLFEDEQKANCAACHPSQPGPNGEPPLFTDFSYDNLGVPANPDLPFYNMTGFNPLGKDWVDLGLGGYLKSAGRDASVYEPEMGKMKVPTLRNVDRRPSPDFVKAYMHNGYFKSLADIVHFYNTRDVAGSDWPAPEYAETVNHDELGNLGLTQEEEDAIVAFLKTLSDGYVLP